MRRLVSWAAVALVIGASVVAAWWAVRGGGEQGAAELVEGATASAVPGAAGLSENPEPLAQADSQQPARADAPPPAVECAVFLEGKPAPNATVLVLPWTEEVRRFAATHLGLPPDVALALGRCVATGEDNLAEVAADLLPAFFSAAAEGGQPAGVLVERPPLEPVRLDCRRGCSLRGIIRLAGFGPLPGVRITARRSVYGDYLENGLQLEPERVCGMLHCSEALTDGAGRFEVNGLPDTYIHIQVDHPSCSSEVKVVMAPKDEDVEIVVHPAAEVEGVVVEGASGRPAAGALINGFFLKDTYVEEDCGWGSTDALGRFSVRMRAEAGPFSLRVVQPGFAMWIRRFDALARGERRSVSIELSPEGVLRGRAAMAGGGPLAGVLLQAWRTDTTDWFGLTRSKEDGSFRLPLLDPLCDYMVMARLSGFEDAFAHGVRPGQEMELTLVPFGELAGRVVGDGALFEEARVRALTEDDSGWRAAVEWVDADAESGEFLFTGLPQGQYRLDALVKGFAPGRLDFVPVAPGQRGEPIEIRMERGDMLRGAVVDAQAGTPVAGASVRLADVDGQGQVCGALPLGAQTDGLGSFLFGPISQRDRISLLVEADGYARQVVAVEQGGARDEALRRIELMRSASLEVRVLDQQGGSLLRFEVQVLGRAQPRASAAAQGADAVRFDGLYPERVWVSVFLSTGPMAGRGLYLEREVVLLPGARQQEVFSLPAGGRVFGTVVASRPLDPNQTYTIDSRPLEGDGDLVRAGVTPNGEYEFASLPAGRRLFQLVEFDPSINVQIARVADVVAGEALELDFLLAETGFRGRLTDREGKGIAGGSVETRRQGADNSAAPYARGASRAEGEYEVLGLSPGEYRVLAQAEGYATRFWEGARVDEGSAPTPLDLDLAPEAVLAVCVVDSAGAALPGARVDVEHLAEGPVLSWPAQETAESGTARFARLAEGRYRARASQIGLFPDWIEAACRAGETVSVNLRLRRLGDLVVEVRGASGEKAAGAPVTLIDLETGRTSAEYLAAGALTTSTGQAATGEDGEVRFAGLPLGRFSVQALGATRTVEVIAGKEPAEVTLAAAP